jgi:hypothetical protein
VSGNIRKEIKQLGSEIQHYALIYLKGYCDVILGSERDINIDL